MRLQHLQQISQLQHRMAEDMKAISHSIDQFLESATLLPLVREEASATSTRSPSASGLPSDDYICDKQPQHSPNDGHHHDCEESHDRSTLLAPCNKHTCHHREQRPLAEITELRDDMESSQTS